MDEKRGAPSSRQEGGRFELRVKGHLDARWADWFDGLTLTQANDGTTVIHGEVADQAALHGLLQTLRDLGLPLISVTQGEADQRHEPRASSPPGNQSNRRKER